MVLCASSQHKSKQTWFLLAILLINVSPSFWGYRLSGVLEDDYSGWEDNCRPSVFLLLFCFLAFCPYWSAAQGQIFFIYFFIHNPSDLNSAFGIWLALNKNLLPERLNPLLRVEGANHYFFLTRWLFNHIPEVGQGTTYQQIQKGSSANNCGSAPQGKALNFTSDFPHLGE